MAASASKLSGPRVVFYERVSRTNFTKAVYFNVFFDSQPSTHP
jgi:hypothetical protein